MKGHRYFPPTLFVFCPSLRSSRRGLSLFLRRPLAAFSASLGPQQLSRKLPKEEQPMGRPLTPGPIAPTGLHGNHLCPKWWRMRPIVPLSFPPSFRLNYPAHSGWSHPSSDTSISFCTCPLWPRTGRDRMPPLRPWVWVHLSVI